MDPVSKKEVWSVLSELRKSIPIILTTHSMEEADYLSDRIGIMYLGRLRAIGTPYGLKQIYGKGYNIDVVLKDSSDVGQISSLIDVRFF